MTYQHIQRGPLYRLLLGMAVVFAAIGWQMAVVTPISSVFTVVALLLAALAYCFRTLTVQDEGTHLAIRYGPLPVFSKRIPFATMTGAQQARSKFVDGWGIHWVPGRGWTYNLWGFDCVEIHLGNKLIRIGTDDPDGLTKFLQSRLTTAL